MPPADDRGRARRAGQHENANRGERLKRSGLRNVNRQCPVPRINERNYSLNRVKEPMSWQPGMRIRPKKKGREEHCPAGRDGRSEPMSRFSPCHGQAVFTSECRGVAAVRSQQIAAKRRPDRIRSNPSASGMVARADAREITGASSAGGKTAPSIFAETARNYVSCARGCRR